MPSTNTAQIDSETKKSVTVKRSDNTAPQNGSDIRFPSLVQSSKTFQALKDELIVSTKLSLTGITNFVVNHEDPCLVDAFLKECFKMEELYNNTIDIDAVELQYGYPGKMRSYHYLDELIYGSIETKQDPDMDIPVPKIDPQTGKRKRNPDGFVNRREVIQGKFKDKLLIIKNVDFAVDFCSSESPGCVEPKALNIFDNFRNPTVKRGCRMLLVSNVKLKFPFQVRTVEISPVNEHEANHIIDSFINLYRNAKYTISFSKVQGDQIVRKLSGLTYTEAGDVFASSLSSSEDPPKSKKINSIKAIQALRKAINCKFMEKGFGLTQLTPRPWEDYITPESSSFTWDVEKLLRDFNEIAELRKLSQKAVEAGKDESKYEDLIERIQTRMPHVSVLYGPGGVGKSAFPIHLAGLLGFDVWDFNVNAVHSKWVGQGSEQARKSINAIMNSSHIIVRIDEYDRAIGATNDSAEGMHEAHKQVESEFMAWLQNGQEENKFSKNNIFVVMTTNHKETITGPMLRSGRVDLVIDIDNFDSESMKETLKTTARRMKNRGIKVLGYMTPEALQQAIDGLGLDQISELCTMKGFTVRDVETLVMEMASHDYYLKRGKKGLAWNTDNFVKVLEHSEGSMKDDDSTGELVLGDREIFRRMEKGDEASQKQLDFYIKKVANGPGFKKC
jgi:hypothetical protein